MTTPLTDSDLDRLLGAWIDEGPTMGADMTLDRVMARIPTLRQRSRVGGWMPHGTQLLRTQAPILAGLVALVTLMGGLALAFGIITRPGPAPSPPPPASAGATVAPSASTSTEASPVPARSEALIAEIRGPVPLSTRRDWVAKSRDPSLGEVSRPGAPSTSVNGYIFTPDSMGRWFIIYLDPTHNYADAATTARDDLRVLIAWSFWNIIDPTLRGSGSFSSDDGECAITFEVFTEAEIAGTLDCVDVLGRYSVGAQGGIQDGVIERLLATFSFDPVRDVFEIGADG